MNIQLKTFGAITDFLTDREVKVPDQMTIKEFRHWILKEFPDIQSQYFRMAIGTRMAEDDTELMDGDEVSLMPPFAGG